MEKYNINMLIDNIQKCINSHAKIKSYYTTEFLHVMKNDGISETTIASSFTGTIRIIERSKKTKPYFLKTIDDKYILKKISVDEFKTFVDICDLYFFHITNSHYSYLVRIYGLFKISGKNKYYIIMPNLLPSENYRWINIFVPKNKKNKCINQIEITKNEYEILINDIKFLQNHNIINYHLLVGIGIDRSGNKIIMISIIGFLERYIFKKRITSLFGKCKHLVSTKKYTDNFINIINTFQINL